MAQQTRLVRLRWENNVSFEMDVKLNGGDWNTVNKMDENGYFAGLWEKGVKNTCMEYFERELNTIGAEMKA